MYQQDSFFDLTLLGRMGLLALSLTMFALTFWITRKILRPRPALVRIVGAILIFWIFVWAAPQVYYQYYRLLFEGLPQQWVILRWHQPLRAFEFLAFQGPSSLSAHSQGIMGWCLILAPWLRLGRAKTV